LYISKIAILGAKESKVRKLLENSLNELGYFINHKNSKGIIYIGTLNRKSLLKLLSKYDKVRIIILVSTDGEYVAPIVGEEDGGGILGSIVADILNAQLILTSRFSELNLINIKEFCWINSLKPLNNKLVKILNNKILNNKKIKIYNNDMTRDYYYPDGYEITKDPKDADIIITETKKINLGKKEVDKLVLEPLQVVVGVVYRDKVPEKVMKNVIELTAKSIGITPKRVDKVIYKEFTENEEVSMTCEDLLKTRNAKIILKTTKRAFNVYTCLGLIHNLSKDL